MKKHQIYTLLFFAICMIPGATMFLKDPAEIKANQMLAPAPQLWSQQGLNPAFPDQVSDYVSDHFGFRQEMITAYDLLMAKIFQVSGNDQVIMGKKGWLFYQETVDDFKGIASMSDRDCYQTARTLRLLQQHFEDNGSRFLFTIAPNKNSLYPQYMPYYIQPLGQEGNRKKLEQQMKRQGIQYADLFQTFKREETVLYHRLDSHWNKEGAVLAWSTILNRLDMETPGYKTSRKWRAKNFHGDLYEMVFPEGKEKDWDINYDYQFQYQYKGQVKDTSDIEIRTTCRGREGKLALCRDSFGNALLPFAAESFGKSYFTRQFPWDAEVLDQEQPDTVILEIVERNLDQIIENAPVMEATEKKGKIQGRPSETQLQAELTVWNERLVKINGSIEETADADSNFYVTIDGVQYEAFPIDERNQGGSGFTLYVPLKIGENREVSIKVSYKKDGAYQTTKPYNMNTKE